MDKRKIARYAVNQTALMVGGVLITRAIVTLVPGAAQYPKLCGLAGTVAAYAACDKFETELNALSDSLMDRIEQKPTVA